MQTFRSKRCREDHRVTALQKWEEINGELVNLVREGRNEDAFELALQLLDYSKDKFGRYHRKVVAVLNSLAMVCISERKYDDAELYLRSALRICERSLGRYLEEGVMTNLNIAKLYHAKAIGQTPQYNDYNLSAPITNRL
jgi:hypothetical protein